MKQAPLNRLLKDHRSTNTVDMDNQVLKSHLHCLKSHMMPSVNKSPLPRAHLKATLVNKLSLSLNSSLQLLHPINSQPTTLLIPSVMPPTTATTNSSSNTTCSKDKVSKMAQLHNAPSVGTMVLKLREPLNIPRAQLSKLPLVTQLLVVKEAATTLLIQLLSSKEAAKARNPSPVTLNNPKQATTPLDIPTIRAHITLHIWTNTSNMVEETTVLDLTARRAVSTNHTKAMECPLLELLTSMPHLLELVHLEHPLFMVGIVPWVEVWESTVALDRLKLRTPLKVLLVAVHSAVDKIPSLVSHSPRAKTSNTTVLTKAIKPAPLMIWSLLAVIQRPPMAHPRRFLKSIDLDLLPIMHQDRVFLLHNPSKVDTVADTQATFNSSITPRAARTAVVSLLEVTKQRAKDTKEANMELTKATLATHTATTTSSSNSSSSNAAAGAATTEDINRLTTE